MDDVSAPSAERDGAARPSDPPGDGSDGLSFEAFVTGASGRLLHAGDLLTGDRARAEELVQLALARAFLRWGSIRDGNPEAYVRRTMVNAYLDWWRRLRWRELPEDAAEGRGPQVQDPAIDVVRRDAVRRALAVLTHRERAVVVLRYWFDLTEVQIAAELGVAPGTVKSTAARALRRLRASGHVHDGERPGPTVRSPTAPSTEGMP